MTVTYNAAGTHIGTCSGNGIGIDLPMDVYMIVPEGTYALPLKNQSRVGCYVPSKWKLHVSLRERWRRLNLSGWNTQRSIC